MGGLTIGVILGAFVSAVGLAALSLSSPLPPRAGDADVVEAALDDGDVVAPAGVEEAVEEAVVEPPVEEEAPVEEAAEVPASETPEQSAAPATEIPLPSGSEFNRPPPEPEAALPTPDAAPSANAPLAPALADDVSAPTFDTATAAQPAVSAQGPAQIVAESGDASAPNSPASDRAPLVAGGPQPLTQPETSATPQVRTALLPQVSQTPEVTPDVTAQDPAAVPLQTPVFPTIGEGAEPATTTPDLPEDVATDGAIEAPTQEVAAVPAFPQPTGLPQVSADVPVEETVEAEAAEPAPAGDLPAIEAFAAPFDPAEERPLMAVVLIDEPDSRIEQSTLTRFTFPVAFAVDPLHPDAEARAAAYREAGFEVVILGSMIADGATAADTEVALLAAETTLPEAVVVIDTPEGRIQGDRPVLDATVAALAESGHGLLAFPRGLNAAEQTASRAGVPAATVFRMLDDEDQRATVITRFLGRAAFTASQEGTVIVVGRTRPDTVTALFSWALGGRSEAVALAPLSATMLRASAP